MKLYKFFPMLPALIFLASCSQPVESSYIATKSYIDQVIDAATQEVKLIIPTVIQGYPVETGLTTPVSLPCSRVPTSSNQEGPYYKKGSPEKNTLLEPEIQGVPIVIFG